MVPAVFLRCGLVGDGARPQAPVQVAHEAVVEARTAR